MGQLASTYSDQENTQKKLKIQVLDARKEIHCKEHPQTVLAIGNLASTYSALGKHTEAEQLKIQVPDAPEKFLGEEHSDTILAMGNRALYTPPPIPTGLLLDSRTPTGFY